MRSRAESICSEEVAGRLGEAEAGRPSEVADCGAGWAMLQLVGEAAAGGPGDRLPNPEFQHRGNKASNL